MIRQESNAVSAGGFSAGEEVFQAVGAQSSLAKGVDREFIRRGLGGPAIGDAQQRSGERAGVGPVPAKCGLHCLDAELAQEVPRRIAMHDMAEFVRHDAGEFVAVLNVGDQSAHDQDPVAGCDALLEGRLIHSFSSRISRMKATFSSVLLKNTPVRAAA